MLEGVVYSKLDNSQEIWLPVKVVITPETKKDPLIQMCKISIGLYSKQPHAWPMYKRKNLIDYIYFYHLWVTIQHFMIIFCQILRVLFDYFHLDD